MRKRSLFAIFTSLAVVAELAYAYASEAYLARVESSNLSHGTHYNTETMLKLLPKETYLKMIRNAEGTNLFRNLYANLRGGKIDILRDGDLSCTFFTSSILWHFRLLGEGPHANTVGFINDLEKSGWKKTDEPKEGDVLIWESQQGASGEEHPHNGFYLGGETAISSSDTKQTPVTHDLTFGGTRKITAIYTHQFLK